MERDVEQLRSLGRAAEADGLESQPRIKPGAQSLAELLGTNRHPRWASPGKIALTDAIPHLKAWPDMAAPGVGMALEEQGGVAWGGEAGGECGEAGHAAVTRAAANGPGAPLPDDVRARFERSLGTDLGGVRVHANPAAVSAAAAIGAYAYTIGQHIYFGAGAVHHRRVGLHPALDHRSLKGVRRSPARCLRFTSAGSHQGV